MDRDVVKEKDNRRTQRVVAILTYIVSFFCLWWVLRQARWQEFRTDVRDIQWGWVVLAVAADVAVYVCHGWRWTMLLAPIDRIPVLRSIQSVYVGLFANEVLPFKPGEIIRCYLQSRWKDIPFSVTISSALIERFFDGVLLGVALIVTLGRTPDIPMGIEVGAGFLAAALVVGAILLAIAIFHRERATTALSGTGWHRHVRVLIHDLHLIGHSRYLYYAAALTIPYLALQVVPVYASMRAYGFSDAAWSDAAVLTICLRLASVIPQAPGNVGTFNMVTTQILTHVSRYGGDVASRFSILLWLVVTLPLVAVGLIALMFTGTHIRDLHLEAKSGMPTQK
jgi:glycosyltransferase 2 family protein